MPVNPKDKLIELNVLNNSVEKLAFVRFHENTETARYDVISFTDGYPEPYTRLSTNLSNPPAAGCFFLKDWSENALIASFLLKEGYLQPTGVTQASGYVTSKEVKPTEKFESILCTSKDLDVLASLTSSGPEM